MQNNGSPSRRVTPPNQPERSSHGPQRTAWPQTPQRDMRHLEASRQAHLANKKTNAPARPQRKAQRRMQIGVITKLRISTVLNLMVFVVLLMGIAGGILWWTKGEYDKVYGSVLSPVKEEWSAITAAPPCGYGVKEISFTPEGDLAIPSMYSLSYGEILWLKDDVKIWLQDPQKSSERVTLLANALAGTMLPIEGFDFVVTFNQSITTALKPENPACVEVPRADKWLVLVYKESIDAPSTPNPQQVISVSGYATPQPLKKPEDANYGVGLVVGPQDEPTPIPTQAPRPTREPQSTPVPYTGVTLYFADYFTDALSQIKVLCARAYSNSVEASACTNALQREFSREVHSKDAGKIKERVQSALTLVTPKIGSQFCSRNLGEVKWEEVIKGNSSIWDGLDSFHAVGEPGDLSLLSDSGTCALVRNHPGETNGTLWITYLKDPYVPNHNGAVDGAIVSRNQPSGAYQTVGSVFVTPLSTR